MIGSLSFVPLWLSIGANPENKVARILWKSSDLKQCIHYPSSNTALQVIIFIMMTTNAQEMSVDKIGSAYGCWQIYCWVENAEIKFWYYNIQKKLYEEATYSPKYWDNAIMKRTGFLWEEGKLEGWPWLFVSVDLGPCTWLLNYLICAQGCWENSCKVVNTYKLTDM